MSTQRIAWSLGIVVLFLLAPYSSIIAAPDLESQSSELLEVPFSPPPGPKSLATSLTADPSAGGYNVSIYPFNDIGLDGRASNVSHTPMLIGYGLSGTMTPGPTGWLRSWNGNPTDDTTGYIAIRDGQIKAIGFANSNPVANLTLEIVDNGSVVLATFTHSDVPSTTFWEELAIPANYSAGDRLSARITSADTDLNNTQVTLWLENAPWEPQDTHILGFASNGNKGLNAWLQQFNGAGGLSTGGWLMPRDGTITGWSIAVDDSGAVPAGSQITLMIDDIPMFNDSFTGMEFSRFSSGLNLPFSAGDRVKVQVTNGTFDHPIALFEFRFDDGTDSAILGWGINSASTGSEAFRGFNGVTHENDIGWVLPWSMDVLSLSGTTTIDSIENATFELLRNGSPDPIATVTPLDTDQVIAIGSPLASSLAAGDSLQMNHTMGLSGSTPYPVGIVELARHTPQITSYWWNFTDIGSQSLTGPTPAYTWDNLGNFTVMLTVMDEDGVTATTTFWVLVTGTGPVADASAGGYDVSTSPFNDIGLDGRASNVSHEDTPMLIGYGRTGTLTPGPTAWLRSWSGNPTDDTNGYIAIRDGQIKAIGFANSNPVANLTLEIVDNGSVVLATFTHSDVPSTTFWEELAIPANYSAGDRLSARITSADTVLTKTQVTLWLANAPGEPQDTHLLGFASNGDRSVDAYLQQFNGADSQQTGGWLMPRDGTITGWSMAVDDTGAVPTGSQITLMIDDIPRFNDSFSGSEFSRFSSDLNLPFSAGDRVKVNVTSGTFDHPIALFEFRFDDGTDSAILGWGRNSASTGSVALRGFNGVKHENDIGWVLPWDMDVLSLSGTTTIDSIENATFELLRNGSPGPIATVTPQDSDEALAIGSPLTAVLKAGDSLQMNHTMGTSLLTAYPVGIVELARHTTPITSYWWNFTDNGSQSLTGPTPAYTWDNLGNFTVMLTVMDEDGFTATTTFWVLVTGTGPVARADSGDSNTWVMVTAGFALDGANSFTTTPSGSITAYWWNFTDAGVPISLTGIAPNYTAASDGNYTVTLTVMDSANLTSSLTFWILVTSNPPVADPSAGGFNTSIAFNTDAGLDASASTDDGGIYQVSWTFNDGTPRILWGMRPSFIWDNNSGIFVVNLTVSDDGGQTDSYLFTINVIVPMIFADARAGGNDGTWTEGTDVGLNGTDSYSNDAPPTPSALQFGRSGIVDPGIDGSLAVTGGMSSVISGYAAPREWMINAISVSFAEPTSDWIINLSADGIPIPGADFFYTGLPVTSGKVVLPPGIIVIPGQTLSAEFLPVATNYTDPQVTVWVDTNDIGAEDAHYLGFSSPVPLVDGQALSLTDGTSADLQQYIMPRSGSLTSVSVVHQGLITVSPAELWIEINGLPFFLADLFSAPSPLIFSAIGAAFNPGDRIGARWGGVDPLINVTVLIEIEWDSGMDSAVVHWGINGPTWDGGPLNGTGGAAEAGVNLPYAMDAISATGGVAVGSPAGYSFYFYDLAWNATYDLRGFNAEETVIMGPSTSFAENDTLHVWAQVEPWNAPLLAYPAGLLELRMAPVAIVNWTWDFNDSLPITLYGPTPAYVWNNLGMYFVTLTVTDEFANTNTTVFYVDIIEAPLIADASAGPNDISVGTGYSVPMNGSASSGDFGITNYWWNFTDGGPVSLTGVSPAYTWSNPGVYQVTLTVMDGIGQTDSIQFMMSVGLQSIPVSLGLNLVSIPSVDSGSPASLLDDSSGDNLTRWDRIWAYDAGSGAWLSLDTSRPAFMNSLASVDFTAGLWINVSIEGDGAITLPSGGASGAAITLFQGWTLVGVPTNMMGANVSTMLAGISYQAVWGPDPGADYLMKSLNGSDAMGSGYGYWIQVDSAQIWNVPSI